MKKLRISAIVLAALTLLPTLAACGSDADKGKDASAVTTAAASAFRPSRCPCLPS